MHQYVPAAMGTLDVFLLSKGNLECFIIGQVRQKRDTHKTYQTLIQEYVLA